MVHKRIHLAPSAAAGKHKPKKSTNYETKVTHSQRKTSETEVHLW